MGYEPVARQRGGNCRGNPFRGAVIAVMEPVHARASLGCHKM